MLRLKPMSGLIIESAALGFPWATVDPFLFCAYHNDAYPKGNANMAPEPSLLRGRQLGMDFEVKDGFRMYHGRTVPGFPSHPHRGFETVTLVRRGYCDHSDSLGATARFGAGDAQWITTGSGIVHAEMFPLLAEDRDNPLELFQIWLNLPRANKMVPAHFKMLWHEEIPVVQAVNEQGRTSRVTVVAGEFGGRTPPSPPPHSWAAQAEADVAIWAVDLEEGATVTLPPARQGSHRALYFYDGVELSIGGDAGKSGQVLLVDPERELPLAAVGGAGRALILQGRPIGEPVVQHGPFVMNERREIQEAISDYQRTGFGGWPWPDDAPVHPRTSGRFAVHPDGRRQEMGS